ncbi:cytochrome C oxidase assembly protein [Sulfitobacter aestuariivivens]|uniref:Cytochrome C oxidase assembly protein n=1 Tax=Sulfitobacter aestuariivivens TaxID=2766981 RepID=A0A927D3X7_9RHOB|nr:cytochrome C oxidase assembly protein [Sulfitobacter aestuariivivens]MBD3663823.1 cytochrome C oxidase assembly protein [Sulfitobacter aestuariivivens]
MSIRAEHELHGRRKGRNIGVGLMLAGFVVLVMALTFVKITQIDFSQAPVNTGAPQQGASD